MLTRMFYTKGQARFLYSVLPVFGLGLLVLGTPRTPQVPSVITSYSIHYTKLYE